MAAEISAKELAAMAGVDAKRMRSFIRKQAQTDASIIGACGQGNRYAIRASDARKLVAAFHASHKTQAHAPSQAQTSEDLSVGELRTLSAALASVGTLA